MACNLGNGSTSLASLTPQEIKSCFIFSFNLCLIASAIFAPYIIFNVFSNKSKEMLSLISSNQNHFVIETNISFATELGHEVIQYVLMLSIEGLHLGIEVHPGTLGSTSSALWLNKSESARGAGVGSMYSRDGVCDSGQKLLVGESFVSFYFVKVEACSGLRFILLLFFFFLFLIDVGLLCGIVQ